jgi:nicotinamide-nucleotide amidase
MEQSEQQGRRLRGAVIVTGSEVLAGRVTDRNGPYVSQQFGERGVETAGIIQVGDRRDDMLRALAQAVAWGVDLIVTTGGLGPTADDLTLEVVAEFAGRPLELHPAMERAVWDKVEKIRERFPDINVDSLRSTSQKQSMQPVGATPLPPVGTAPGSIVPPSGSLAGPLVVVLPGPPRELTPMWEDATVREPLASLLAQAAPFEERMLRVVGLPESDLAAALTEIETSGVAIDRLEITTCMRSGEIEIVTRFAPSDSPVYDALDAAIRSRYGARLYSDDGSQVEAIVRRQLAARGWTVGLAESCTGGLVTARLIDAPGASGVVRGSVVAYDNAIKTSVLGVAPDLLREHGAVSSQVAAAMAEGAVRALGADCAVAVTGIAGPGGGSAERPVGTVWFAAAVPGVGTRVRHVWIPGDRASVRDRAVTYALHVLRGALDEA